MKALFLLTSHQSKLWICQQHFSRQSRAPSLLLNLKGGFSNQSSPLFTSVQFLSKDSNDASKQENQDPSKQDEKHQSDKEGNINAGSKKDGLDEKLDLGENYFDRERVKEKDESKSADKLGESFGSSRSTNEKMKVVMGKIKDGSVYAADKMKRTYAKGKKDWPKVQKKVQKKVKVAKVRTARAYNKSSVAARKAYNKSSVVAASAYNKSHIAANKTQKLLSHQYKEFRKIEFSKGTKKALIILKDNSANAYDKYAPDGVKNVVTNLQTGVVQEMENTKVWWRLSNDEQSNTNKGKTQASYKELMSMHDFKRDKNLTAMVVVCSCLPGGFVLLSVPIMLFPRTMMPWSFWDDKQRKEFYKQYHKERKGSHTTIVNHIEAQMRDPATVAPVKSILDSLVDGSGDVKRITNKDLLRLKKYCNKDPFDLTDSNIEVIQAMCTIFTVRPGSTVEDSSIALRDKAIDIMNMDMKLREMKLKKLTEVQVMTACFIRGMNSASLSHDANLYWLKNWLNLTNTCNKTDAWFVLYAAVLLSKNFVDSSFQRLDYGKFNKRFGS